MMAPDDYGLWVLLPALSAIALAIATRKVLPSLAVGVLVASFMLLPCLSIEQRHGTTNAVTGTARVAVQDFIWEASLKDIDRLKILEMLLRGRGRQPPAGGDHRAARVEPARRAGDRVGGGSGGLL